MRSMIGFVDRWVVLAGRTCCAGRSWDGLDRSLARRAGETPPGFCELSRSVASDGSDASDGLDEPVVAVEDVRA